MAKRFLNFVTKTADELIFCALPLEKQRLRNEMIDENYSQFQVVVQSWK